jgi:hypothetical protein
MLKYIEDGNLKKLYKNAADCIINSLIDNYAVKQDMKSNGLLFHSTYDYKGNIGVDECNIWGDYFYLEALTRYLKLIGSCIGNEKCTYYFAQSLDREWYMPFEHHRAKLVELIDNCVELFENDKDFLYFNLDGQTIVLEDYLEIKPYMREKLEKYVTDGKLIVGPW